MTNPPTPSMDRNYARSILIQTLEGYREPMLEEAGAVRDAAAIDLPSWVALDAISAVLALITSARSVGGEVVELREALRDVLATGLNGGNNLRLAYIAASQKELGEKELARAAASERAVNRARAALNTSREGGE